MAHVSIVVSSEELAELHARAHARGFKTLSRYALHCLAVNHVDGRKGNSRGNAVRKRRMKEQPVFPPEILTPDEAPALRSEIATLRAVVERLTDDLSRAETALEAALQARAPEQSAKSA